MVGSYSWGEKQEGVSVWGGGQAARLPKALPRSQTWHQAADPARGKHWAYSVTCSASTFPQHTTKRKNRFLQGWGEGITPGGKRGLYYSQTPAGAGHRPTPQLHSAPGHTRPALSSASGRGQTRGTPRRRHSEGKGMVLGILSCSCGETEDPGSGKDKAWAWRQ